MSLSTARRTKAPVPASDSGLIRSKGLASGQLGLFAAVMIGISTIAPVNSLVLTPHLLNARKRPTSRRKWGAIFVFTTRCNDLVTR